MRKYISSIAALGAALAMVAATPAADAGPRHYRGNHYNGHHGHYGRYHHRGRGYWRNGRWIALGIGAAIAAGAAGAYYDRDCYWRHGYRYCD
jgi:hypothetical protein